MKKNNILLLFAATALAGCIQSASKDTAQIDAPVSLDSYTVVTKIEDPVVVDENRKMPTDRPVDVAPLVSNYLAGMLSEYRRESDQAAEFFSEAEGADPKNYFLQEKSFSLQLAMGNVDEAVRLAYELVEFSDALPFAQLMIFTDSVVKGDLDQARSMLEKAATSSPDLVHFQILRSYLNLAEGGDVQQIVDELVTFKHHPSLAPHKHYHLGRLYEISGMVDDAEQAYKVAHEQDPSSVFPVIRMGRIYQQQGEKLKAQELYDAFVKHNPSSTMLQEEVRRLKSDVPVDAIEASVKRGAAEVLFGFATLMGNKHDRLAGNQVLNMVSYLAPDYPYTYFYKGVLEEQYGEHAQAMAAYAKVKKGQGPYLATQVRIAQAMFDQGEVDRAISRLEKLHKQNSSLLAVQRLLAEMYYNAKRYEKAVTAYSDLIELVQEPQVEDSWDYFARGASYERLSEFDKATSDIEMSIKLRPNNAMALNYLGYMWVEQNVNIEKAFVYISRALLLMPNDAAILDSMGWVLYSMKEYEKAVLFLEKSVSIEPEDPTINAHLGDVYEKLGRLEEAVKQWQRALSSGKADAKMLKHLELKLSEHADVKNADAQ